MLNLALVGKIYGWKDKERLRRSWINGIKEWRGLKAYAEVKREAEDRYDWMVMSANLRTETALDDDDNMVRK